jgi:hypothetical protein
MRYAHIATKFMIVARNVKLSVLAEAFDASEVDAMA